MLREPGSQSAAVQAPLIEPQVQQHWDIPHATWFTLMGVGGGIFLLARLLGIEHRLGIWLGLPVVDLVSFVVIGLGGLVLIWTLGRPLRVLRAVMKPGTSWISRGAIADFVFLVVGGVLILPGLTLGGGTPFAWLPWDPWASNATGKAMEALALLSAAVVIFYAGQVLADGTAIPYWRSPAIPIPVRALLPRDLHGHGDGDGDPQRRADRRRPVLAPPRLPRPAPGVDRLARPHAHDHAGQGGEPRAAAARAVPGHVLRRGRRRGHGPADDRRPGRSGLDGLSRRDGLWLLLRRDVDAGARRAPRRWLAALPLVGGAGALVLWQAASLTVGLVFLGAVAAALVLLAPQARGLAWLGRRRPRLPWLAWRQGLSNLARPGGHGASVVVALGIGVMLLVAVGLLEASLGRQLDHERRREAPSFFFVDIQPAQRERFEGVVREAAGATPALTPVVRARLAAVDGEAVTRALVEQRQAEGHERIWYYTRDYVLTAAAALPAGNVVTAGRWWGDNGAAARPQASVEEGAARDLGLGVGSRIAFDVQGVRLEAEVTSLRQVDWQTLTTNFFVILSPGALDGAPTTYVATARVPPDAEAAVQDAVVRTLPNVTAIPQRDVLERVRQMLDQMAVAVRAMALFAIAAGLAVMVGALGASRYQRLRASP